MPLFWGWYAVLVHFKGSIISTVVVWKLQKQLGMRFPKMCQIEQKPIAKAKNRNSVKLFSHESLTCSWASPTVTHAGAGRGSKLLREKCKFWCTPWWCPDEADWGCLRKCQLWPLQQRRTFYLHFVSLASLTQFISPMQSSQPWFLWWWGQI